MSEKFIVIDDSSTIHKVIKLAFPSGSVEVISAESYIEAKEVLANNVGDLIFVDVGMLQDKNFYVDLKHIVGSTPIVVLVGTYDDVQDENLSAAGYRHFLNKPFDGGTLLETVKSAYPDFSLENKKSPNTGANAIDLGLNLSNIQEDLSSSISSAFTLNSNSEKTPTRDMVENDGLITPILEEKMESIVKKAVFEYCDLHFAQVARNIIQGELDNLLSEKERLLKENA